MFKKYCLKIIQGKSTQVDETGRFHKGVIYFNAESRSHSFFLKSPYIYCTEKDYAGMHITIFEN